MGVSLRAIGREKRERGSKKEAEFELLDTGIFDDDRYFDVFIEYAKATPEDILMRVTVHNRGPETAHSSCRICGFATHGRGTRNQSPACARCAGGSGV